MVHNCIELITVNPFRRIHEGWKITDQHLNSLIEQFDFSINFTNFIDCYDYKKSEPSLNQQAFLHVVTESVYHYPHNGYGEKTFKPISCFRPFVLVTVPGALQHLRDIGFQTFSTWWNEDYDNIQDPTKRLYAIFDIIDWVCQQDIASLRHMIDQMQPVLQHNYDFYYNKMIPNQIKKFDLACKQNLQNR